MCNKVFQDVSFAGKNHLTLSKHHFAISRLNLGANPIEEI